MQQQAMNQFQGLYGQQQNQLSGYGYEFGGSGGGGANSRQIVVSEKERTLFQEIKNDVTTFIKTHRGMIYFIILALLVDHFAFKGVFKARLQAMLESLVVKVEEKVKAAA